MFEKFSNLEIDSAGRGGEYTVQAGFGWTNGVVLWIAQTYGHALVAPQCPDIVNVTSTGGGQNGANANAAFRIGVGPGSVTVVAILSIVAGGAMVL